MRCMLAEDDGHGATTGRWGSLDDDLVHEILVRHLVVRMHNPAQRRLALAPETRQRFPADVCNGIAAHSPYEGQHVTLQTLQSADYETHPAFLSRGGVGEGVAFGRMFEDLRFMTEATREKMKTAAFALIKTRLYRHPRVHEVDGLMRRCCPPTPESVAGCVFGLRYRQSWLYATSIMLGLLRCVCKAWDTILRPFCLRPEIAHFVDDYAEVAKDVCGSSALRGMPPLNVLLLERGARTRICIARRYAKVAPSGGIEYARQTFPLNLVFGRGVHVTLRIAAVDGGATTCVHVPKLAKKARPGANNAHSDRFIQMAVSDPVRGGLCFKFPGSRPPQAKRHDPIVAGMFLADGASMMDIRWTPSATSLSFQSVTGLPLSPLRVIAHFGREPGRCDHVATSEPFYVLSRKAKQIAVDAAARKRRKA